MGSQREWKYVSKIEIYRNIQKYAKYENGKIKAEVYRNVEINKNK